MANEYATVGDLRSYLKLLDVEDETGLTLALRSASESVEDYCGRRFWLDPSVTVRYFTASASSLLRVDDIGASDGVIVATDDAGNGTWSTTWAGTDYDLTPRNAAADGRPWTRIEVGKAGSRSFPCEVDAVKLTAKYGWPAVPGAVKMATLIQASRLYNRADSPYGVTGSPEMGGELRLLSRLDADVEQMVRPFRRVLVA